ncbi:MAG: arginine--tRNA ligase [Candidatus Staskawiczbacteria bacterium]|jgi:arginyl-tRNA synthetase
MIKGEINRIISETIGNLQTKEVFPAFDIPPVVIDCPAEKTHGDYATNISLHIARIIKGKPIEAAEKIVSEIKAQNLRLFKEIEVKEPGFINFFISPAYLQNQIKEILSQKEKFGSSKFGQGKKVNVEFISANPTGPLTLGNGRGGFCGDVLSNVLEKAGFDVTREYYINDRGEQIKKLGHSVIGDEQAVYKGKYIEDLAKKVKDKDPEKAGEKAAKIILEDYIKPTIEEKMGIKFDVWFSEKKLYDKGMVDKTIEEIKKNGFTYESEGALWFKSKSLGDDKDRVLIRKDGNKTYFASDIAYLKDKFERGFGKIVIFLGADHHGYINRLRAATQAMSFDKDSIKTIIMQLVAVWSGEEGDKKLLKMSKREGTAIDLDDLIKELNIDTVRFFFLMRAPNTHLGFDMDLAREQSSKNPVYYVQYAHARINSLLKKAELNAKGKNLELLNHSSELQLIKHLVKFPEVVEDTAGDFQVQRLAQYAAELADCFHKFYEDCRVIDEDKNISEARLSLALAARIVLKNTLDIMGISAPEKM